MKGGTYIKISIEIKTNKMSSEWKLQKYTYLECVSVEFRLYSILFYCCSTPYSAREWTMWTRKLKHFTLNSTGSKQKNWPSCVLYYRQCTQSYSICRFVRCSFETWGILYKLSFFVVSSFLFLLFSCWFARVCVYNSLPSHSDTIYYTRTRIQYRQ